ncbi:hypothetical protein AWU68_2150 [Corynebacterium simulans]|nr:hypothetical protein WM42_2159 [Corynebacterium simulans]AMO92397.1 hypothetical protein AWU68_2150 [Corynebacterium simulans]
MAPWPTLGGIKSDGYGCHLSGFALDEFVNKQCLYTNE